MKFRVVIEFDDETNAYSAICPEMPKNAKLVEVRVG